MIGTTRSRVSVFLSKFKRQGLITYDRHGHMSVRKPRSAAGWNDSFPQKILPVQI
jgi:hypothetical protein